MGSTSRPRMRGLVIFCALVSIAIAGGKGGNDGKGKGKGGKGKGGKGKGGKGGNGGKDDESMTTMIGGKDEMMQEMMDEKEGLCLSNDQVHMMCGIGTKLQEKMDAALKQCVPVEMMAATVEDMQDVSMAPDIKLLSSGRAFDFDEPSERGRGRKVLKGKKMKKKTKESKKSEKDKKPTKPSKKGKKQNKYKKNKKPSKKPSKPSDFKSCEASCPSMDEMRASAMEEMKTELCVLNAIGWMDDEGNMMQDVEDADMAEFPEAVREAVSEAKIKDCAEVATAAKMEAMMKDKKFQKKYGACFENECYSEEDMEAMTEMMEMMAGMQCWDRAFTKACPGHIKENLMNMASNMLMGK